VTGCHTFIALRGGWCYIIILNVHAPSEEKSNDKNNIFYEELEQGFDHICKRHTKILLVDFNAKLGREDISKPTNGNKSLHQDINDNSVRIVNLVTLKIYLMTARCSHTETFMNTPGPLPMGRLTTRLITY